MTFAQEIRNSLAEFALSITSFTTTKTKIELVRDIKSSVLSPADEVTAFQTECQDNIEEPDWLCINRMLMQTAVTASAGDCIVMQQLEQVTHLATAGTFDLTELYIVN